MLKINNNLENKLSRYTLAEPRKPRKIIDVEELLQWTYHTQRAHVIDLQDNQRTGPVGYKTSFLAIERFARMGVKVDNVHKSSTHHTHTDAETIHNTVKTLKPLWIGLLIHYANMGTRPDWMPGATPKIVPALDKHGKPKIVYHDARTKRKPAYCVVRSEPSIEEIEFVRGVYTQWWDAMDSLLKKLPELQTYTVKMNPYTLRKPWL